MMSRSFSIATSYFVAATLLASCRFDRGGLAPPTTGSDTSPARDTSPIDLSSTRDAGFDGPALDLRDMDTRLVPDDGARDLPSREDGAPDWIALPDEGAVDGAVPDGAVPDAAVPDAAVPDAAVPDASADSILESCRARYGSAPGYIHCWATPKGCAFNAETKGGACTEMCRNYGGTCLRAMDNPNTTGAECSILGIDTCDTKRSTNICVCSQ